MASGAEFERFRTIKAANVDKLMARRNVVGVGIGAKLREGAPTGELAVRVYVVRKQDLKRLKNTDLVPKTLDGVPTDVVEIGEPVPYNFTTRERPASGGDSIGHIQVTAGTLGYLMRDRTDGTSVILSNNHVLANADGVAHPRAVVGDCVVQPGAMDGGVCAADQIATLKRWVQLVEVGSGTNLVDAAIAQPLAAGDVQNTIRNIGCVSQWREATDADVVVNLADPDNVQKSGRTTEYTTGKITDIDATVTINYGVFSATHDEVIVTDDMASPGDSGSLLLDMNRKALGLLFGGSIGSVVFYSRISNVLNALNLEFLPCGTSCLIGPFRCRAGGPDSRCKVGGPRPVCLSGGPWDRPWCILGGPDCRVSGPIPALCTTAGPVCPIGGPVFEACKAPLIIGCLAGPPLLRDPMGQIINPADIVGQIVINADGLTDEQKISVAKLVNKLTGVKDRRSG